MMSLYLLKGPATNFGYPYTNATRKIDLGQLTYKDAVAVSNNTAGIENKYYLTKSEYHIPLKLVKGDPSSMELQEENTKQWLQTSQSTGAAYAPGYASVKIFYRPSKISNKYYATSSISNLTIEGRYDFDTSYSSASNGQYYAYTSDTFSGGESTTAYKRGTFEANVTSGQFCI